MCVLLFVSFVGRMCLKEPVTVLENGMVCCGKIQRRCTWWLRLRYISMYEIICAVKSSSKGNIILCILVILVLSTCKGKPGKKCFYFELLYKETAMEKAIWSYNWHTSLTFCFTFFPSLLEFFKKCIFLQGKF